MGSLVDKFYIEKYAKVPIYIPKNSYKEENWEEIKKIKIWHYLDLYAFKAIFSDLKKRALTLTRSDLLRDPWEAEIPDGWLAAMKNINDSAFKQMEDLQKNRALKKASFLHCWHINPDESILFWERQTDSHFLKELAIETTLGTLQTAMTLNYEKKGEMLSIARILYVSEEEYQQAEMNLLLPVFYKRKGFSAEKEVRIVANFLAEYTAFPNKEMWPETRVFEFDENADFIEKIHISPLLKKWRKDILLKELKNMNIPEDKIHCSDLYVGKQ